MKGKKACRNLRGSYIDDLVGELERLESAGLSTDGTQIDEGVQDTHIVRLPDGNRCKLVKSSFAVATLGGVMAFTAYLVCEDEAEPIIVVDRLFDQLSEQGKRYILAHEAGHLHFGHIGTPESAVASMASDTDVEGYIPKNRNIEQEYQADWYAALVNGKKSTVAAMKEVRKLMAKNSWIRFDTAELNRRLRHLMMAQTKNADTHTGGLSA